MSQPTRRFHVLSALRPTSLRIESGAARGLVERGALLLDVRREDDHGVTIGGAVRVTPDQIPGQLASFARDVPIVLGCT